MVYLPASLHSHGCQGSSTIPGSVLSAPQPASQQGMWLPFSQARASSSPTPTWGAQQEERQNLDREESKDGGVEKRERRGLKKAASRPVSFSASEFQTSFIPLPQQRPRAQACISVREAQCDTAHSVAQVEPQTCCHLTRGFVHVHLSTIMNTRRHENPPTSSPWASSLCPLFLCSSAFYCLLRTPPPNWTPLFCSASWFSQGRSTDERRVIPFFKEHSRAN